MNKFKKHGFEIIFHQKNNKNIKKPILYISKIFISAEKYYQIIKLKIKILI